MELWALQFIADGTVTGRCIVSLVRELAHWRHSGGLIEYPLPICGHPIIAVGASSADSTAMWLSLSEIKSEHSKHSNGVIRRELESEECVRWLEQPAAAAHPCSGKGVFSRCWNRPYKKGAHGAGAARQRRRHGQDIPAGSSQSAVPYGHSAMATGVQLAGRECPWHEAAG